MKLRMRTNLRRLYLVALVLHLCLVTVPTAVTFWAGLTLVVLGRALQVWAHGHLRKINDRRGPDPPIPTTGGPYGRVRNPIAWASFISDAGFGVIAAAPIPLVIYAGVYWFITARRIARYEEPMLRRRCGEAYEEYCRAVPRILPRLVPAKGAGGPGFTFRSLWDNAEVSRLLGAFSVVAVFRVIWVWREGAPREGEDFWFALGAALVLGAASLILQSVEYRPHLGRKKVLGWLKGTSRV